MYSSFIMEKYTHNENSSNSTSSAAIKGDKESGHDLGLRQTYKRTGKVRG